MKDVNTRLTATLVVGLLLAIGTQAASAKTFVIHHGNFIHPQLYDSAGHRVNRLPAPSHKKVVCGVGGRTNYCKAVN